MLLQTELISKVIFIVPVAVINGAQTVRRPTDRVPGIVPGKYFDLVNLQIM